MSDDSLSDLESEIDTFMSNRDIYVADISGRNWDDVYGYHFLPSPKSLDFDKNKKVASAWEDPDAGDIVLAYQSNHDLWYGIGIVTEMSLSDLSTQARVNALLESSMYKSVFWSTIASNGEHFVNEPLEAPEDSFVEVDREYFKDVLQSADAEVYPPPADELFNRVVAADRLRNVDELLDNELPDSWNGSEKKEHHIRAVVINALLNRNPDSKIRKNRAFAQNKVARLGDIEESKLSADCGSNLYQDIDGIKKFHKDGFDPALLNIHQKIRSLDNIGDFEIKDNQNETTEADNHRENDEPNLYPIHAGPDSENLHRTVSDPVEKAIIRDHNPSVDLNRFDGDSIPIWGHQNDKPVQPGDYILLYKNGEYQYAAEVDTTTYNPDLSETIWEPKDGQHFNYIYYLKGLREVELTQPELNTVLDYQSNYKLQGFSRLSDYREELIQKKFGGILEFIQYVSVGMVPDLYNRIADQFEDTNQVVFHGPPGTGKTFHAQEFADWWIHDTPETVQQGDQYRLVTFHPSFSYEDFVEGLTTKSDENGSVEYTLEKGILREFVNDMQAWDEHENYDIHDFDNEPRYILIIDEINRGKMASILGELVTLLEADKREGEENETKVNLAHSGKEFSLPSNLYIIGTMNTADRSISLVDAAIRRRFGFVSFPPDYEVLADEFNIADSDLEKLAEDDGGLDGLHAASILALEAINEKILGRADLGKGKQLGHSYLLDTDSEEAVIRAWKYKLLPLLEEYFFESFGEIRELLDAEHTHYLLDLDHEQIHHKFGEGHDIEEPDALRQTLREVANIAP